MCLRLKTPNYKKFITIEEIFEEAIRHNRWNFALFPVLENIQIEKYVNNTFEEIINKVYQICKDIKGLGDLTVYDITSAICRYHKILITKIYIVGGGPKNAVKLLNIRCKTHKINNKSWKYIEIQDLFNSLEKSDYIWDHSYKLIYDGDILESYICNWQKDIKNRHSY
jgi:hypothetical protein